MHAKFLITFYLLLVCSFSVAQTSNVSNTTFSFELAGHTLKIPIYSSINLGQLDPTIRKAVIVIHGTNRNADDYFNNIQVAADKASDLSAHTLIVAPQFLTEADIEYHNLDDEHLYWTNGGWKAGSNSRDEDANPRPIRIPSYAVLDSLIMHITRQFSNLELITLAGHSAGGQVVQRMAATSPIGETLCEAFGVQIRFVVANPSSYVYLDRQRRRPGTVDEFSIPSSNCADFNEWKYGLEDLYTYPGLSGVDSIRARFKRRQVTYLLGQRDNDPGSSSLDLSCAANLQGSHRLERGIIYYNYLQHYYGSSVSENHSISQVPDVGHSNFDMFNSSQGLSVLFGPSTPSCSGLVFSNNTVEDFYIQVFPNPADELIFLEVNGSTEPRMEALIFDLQGRQVWSGLVTGEQPIDVSQLPAGLYFLYLEVGSFRAEKKLVVK